MATTPQLSQQQNDRLRKAMIQVWEDRFSRNASEMARALGLRQPTISEFLRGRGGASYDTAKRFAVFIHKTVESVIGPDERGDQEILDVRGNERLPEYRDTPGYLDALREAYERQPDWSPLVWEAVAREKVPQGRTQVLAADLLAVGERLQRATTALKKKGWISPEPVERDPRPMSVQRRYMSDIRRLAGIGGQPSSGNIKLR